MNRIKGGVFTPPADLIAQADALVARLKSATPLQRQTILDHINSSLPPVKKRRGHPPRLDRPGDYVQDPMYKFALMHLMRHPAANRNEVSNAYAKMHGADGEAISVDGRYKRISTFWERAQTHAKSLAELRTSQIPLYKIVDGEKVLDKDIMYQFVGRIVGFW